MEIAEVVVEAADASYKKQELPGKSSLNDSFVLSCPGGVGQPLRPA